MSKHALESVGCHIDSTDFELMALSMDAHRRLRDKGILPADIEMTKPLLQPILGTVENIGVFATGLTSGQRLELTQRYDNAATSQKLFFESTDFQPPEHGDISF